MLRHWNGSREQESLTLYDIPLTTLRGHGVFIPYECVESGDCHPDFVGQEAFMEQVVCNPEHEAPNKLREKRVPRRHNESKNIDMKAKESCSSKSKLRLHAPGHVELYPGKKVKILDKERAYASPANGDAAIFQCAGCGKCLLANKDMKLLYCSECGTLTPTEIKGELKDSEYF